MDVINQKLFLGNYREYVGKRELNEIIVKIEFLYMEGNKQKYLYGYCR